MKKSFAFALTCGLLLTACFPKTDSGVAPTARAEGYEDLSDGVIGNGEAAVLFFFAAWCPMCQDKDEKLNELYGSSEIPVKTYKVDFDTEDGLKRKYNIGMQDTFVLVDGEGAAVKTEVAPSFSQLKRLLYMNIEKAQGEETEEEEETEAPEDAEESEETEAPEDHEAMHKEEAPAKVMADAGQYTTYSDGVIGNGKESVLFFHAAWCPACKKNNGLLTDWYGSSKFSRSVYKLDFDTATVLRSKYGVTGQDTFILIDGAGNEVQRARFPSEDALRDLLG